MQSTSFNASLHQNFQRQEIQSTGERLSGLAAYADANDALALADLNYHHDSQASQFDRTPVIRDPSNERERTGSGLMDIQQAFKNRVT